MFLTRDMRAALSSVRWSFFIAGLLSATLSARLPAVQARLDLSDSELAVALVGLNLGAVAGLQAGTAVVRLLGSRGAARVVLPSMAVALVALLLPTSLAFLTAGFFLFLGINALMDVILNMHGAHLEGAMGRNVMASVHAFGSLGMVAGSVFGAGAERVHVSLEAHFLGLAAVCIVWSWPLGRHYASFDDDPSGTRETAGDAGSDGSWRRCATLGFIAFLLCLAEGSITDWVAVYLISVDAPASIAALGFGVFTACITVGRLKADAVVARFGAGRTYAVSTLFGSTAMVVGVVSHSYQVVLVSIGLYGFGLAAGFPLAMAAAARINGMATSKAIARVGTIGYSGFFLGPLLIGAVQAWSSLGVALAVIAMMLAGSALLARALNG